MKGTGSSVGSRAYIQLYDTRGRTLALAQTTLGSAWTRFGASGVATDRTAALYAYLWVRFARKTGEAFYVDGVSLVGRGGGRR